jgi:YfiH family protein
VSSISDRFSGVGPSTFAFSWLLAFTTLAQHDGETIDFMAGRKEAQRRELEQALAPLSVIWLTLEHGANVVDLSDPGPNQQDCNKGLPASRIADESGEENHGRQRVCEGAPFASPVADGAILTEPGYAVAFTTADCLPIICVSERPRVVTAIHGGWRSLAAGIIEEALRQLECLHGVDPASLKVWIGPAIAAEDYEVSEVVREKLLARPAIDERFFKQSRPGYWFADLPAAALAIFASHGVIPGNLERYPLSTGKSPLFHCARRDKEASGRMATLVGIKPTL